MFHFFSTAGCFEIAQEKCVKFFFVETRFKEVLSLSDFSDLLNKCGTKEPLKVVDLDKIGILHHEPVLSWETLDLMGMGTWMPFSEEANQLFHQKLKEPLIKPFCHTKFGLPLEIILVTKKALVPSS